MSASGTGGTPLQESRSKLNRGQILIHEALHLLAKGNSDVFLANKADPKGKKKFGENESAKASEYLQKQVNEYCNE